MWFSQEVGTTRADVNSDYTNSSKHMSLGQLHLLPPAQQEAILNGPALAPPEGVIPILVNPPNQNVLALVILTILLFLATSVFTLAGYANVFYVKKFYLEDYLAFLGYVFYVAKVGCSYALIHTKGIFIHQWNTRVRDLAYQLYIVHIESEFYAVSVLLLKTAILLEWVRIFVPRDTRSVFYWTCHTLIWLNVIFYAAILIGANNSCRPFAKLWDKTLPGSCDDNNAFDVASAIYGFVSDTIILLMPHRVIWRLHMKMKKKIGIAIIFTIGIGACTSSAYRLYASIHYLETNDSVYGIGDLALGTDAELVCALLVYYVPILPKAFKGTSNSSNIATRPFRFFTPRLKESSLFSSSAYSGRSAGRDGNGFRNNTDAGDSSQELQDRRRQSSWTKEQGVHAHARTPMSRSDGRERDVESRSSDVAGSYCYYPNVPHPPLYLDETQPRSHSQSEVPSAQPTYPGHAYLPRGHIVRTTRISIAEEYSGAGGGGGGGGGSIMQVPWYI
ncbi:hypothetical protein F5Y17DRAFT_412468 [Xylariaceae sp. FL0594]|nr:hypothetical protein F5Y17DRAFT_412468 [Xylariaceae sp. FL0594]